MLILIFGRSGSILHLCDALSQFIQFYYSIQVVRCCVVSVVRIQLIVLSRQNSSLSWRRVGTFEFIWIVADSSYVVNLLLKRDEEVSSRFKVSWPRVLDFTAGIHLHVSHIFANGIRQLIFRWTQMCGGWLDYVFGFFGYS